LPKMILWKRPYRGYDVLIRAVQVPQIYKEKPLSVVSAFFLVFPYIDYGQKNRETRIHWYLGVLPLKMPFF